MNTSPSHIQFWYLIPDTQSHSRHIGMISWAKFNKMPTFISRPDTSIKYLVTNGPQHSYIFQLLYFSFLFTCSDALLLFTDWILLTSIELWVVKCGRYQWELCLSILHSAHSYSISSCQSSDVFQICIKRILYYKVGGPRLSGHIGTGTYPVKRIVQIWELCLKLNTASSVESIYAIMYSAIVLSTSYHSYKMDIGLNKT